MKPKVLITKNIPQHVEDFIAKHCDYKIWREKDSIPEEVLLREIANVQGLMTPKGKVNEELLKHAPNLKVVSNIAVGYETFDIGKMDEHRVLGTHTPYVLDDTVADLIFGLILSSARRVSELDHYVKNGKWDKIDDPHFLAKDVHHATLGIIGLGRIGEKVVQRATQGFSMDVLYYNRSDRPEVETQFGIHKGSLEEVLKQSDFILTMVPLTSETYHLIGENELDMMKDDAIFINASRGKVVDEPALIRSLNEGRIAGAALDVFELEPVEKSNPLLFMDNVVTTPHIGSATAKAREAMAMKAAENLVEAVTGGTPENVVKELRHLVQ